MAGRRAKRLRASHHVPVGFVGPSASFTGDLVDLSKTGLLVRCSQSLEPGAPGRIGIPMGQETMRAMVAVRRHVPPIGLAFEFIQMSLRDRELLRRLLKRLQVAAGT
jgi:hypothetical protein